MISAYVRLLFERRIAELMAQAMVPDDATALARAAEAQGVRWALDRMEEER